MSITIITEPSIKQDDVEKKKADIKQVLSLNVGDKALFHTFNIDSWKAYYYHIKKQASDTAKMSFSFKRVKGEISEQFGQQYCVTRSK